MQRGLAYWGFAPRAWVHANLNAISGAAMGFFSNTFAKIFPSANAAEVVVAPPPPLLHRHRS